jgi:hypothetical protein
MRHAVSTFLLVFLTVEATTSQDRPDFSGTWSLVKSNGSPANVPRTLIIRASFKGQSVRGDPISPPLVTIEVDPRSGNAIRPGSYFVGTMGGIAGGLPSDGPRTESHHSTRWDGDRLVIDLSYYADGRLTSEHGRGVVA